MNSPASPARPPRLASWLLGLFLSDDLATPIAGDLFEEFSEVSRLHSPRAARRWYWSQTLKTIPHIMWIGVRTAPLRLILTTIGGFLLLSATLNLPEWVFFAVVNNHCKYFLMHASAYRFWLVNGIPIGWSVVAAAVGISIALLARGREMIASLTLSALVAAFSIGTSAVFFLSLNDGWAITDWRAFSFTLPILRHGSFVFSLPHLPHVIFAFHEPFFITGLLQSVMIIAGAVLVRAINNFRFAAA
jgi:hypothetical protein